MAYIKEERYDKETTEAIAAHYKEILRLLGEDPEREGLVKTPERVAKALQFAVGASAEGGGNRFLDAVTYGEKRFRPKGHIKRSAKPTVFFRIVGGGIHSYTKSAVAEFKSVKHRAVGNGYVFKGYSRNYTTRADLGVFTGRRESVYKR